MPRRTDECPGKRTNAPAKRMHAPAPTQGCAVYSHRPVCSMLPPTIVRYAATDRCAVRRGQAEFGLAWASGRAFATVASDIEPRWIMVTFFRVQHPCPPGKDKRKRVRRRDLASEESE